jgi:hypothetical protein
LIDYYRKGENWSDSFSYTLSDSEILGRAVSRVIDPLRININPEIILIDVDLIGQGVAGTDIDFAHYCRFSEDVLAEHYRHW